jgi:hypothetical protein
MKLYRAVFTKYKHKRDTIKVEGRYVIVMEPADGIFEDLLKLELTQGQIHNYTLALVDLLRRLADCGYTHGDFHTENICYKYLSADRSRVALAVLDMGRSSSYTSQPFVDIISLLESTNRTLPWSGIREPTWNYMKQHLYNLARAHYGIELNDDNLLDSYNTYALSYFSKYRPDVYGAWI